VNWAECLSIAIGEFLEAERSDFEKSWQDLTPPQRKTLLAVALGEGSGIFSRGALSRIGMAQSTIHQAVVALVEKGKILKIAGVEGNTYVVQDSIDGICLQMIGGRSAREIVERLILAIE
jgi:DNA-binding MarR family transcriptional regulator